MGFPRYDDGSVASVGAGVSETASVGAVASAGTVAGAAVTVTEAGGVEMEAGTRGVTP